MSTASICVCNKQTEHVVYLMLMW